MNVPIEAHAARIRLLFVVLILWMPLQYLISAKYGEPYPALVMPGFPGALTDPNGNIRITNVSCKILFRDGSVAWTSAYDLLSQAPSAYHNAIMLHMFSPAPAKPPEVTPGRLTALLFPGRSLSRYQHVRKELDPATKDWLRHRIESLYPSQVVTRVTFVWYDELFNLKQDQPIITRQPLGLREGPLQ